MVGKDNKAFRNRQYYKESWSWSYNMTLIHARIQRGLTGNELGTKFRLS